MSETEPKKYPQVPEFCRKHKVKGKYLVWLRGALLHDSETLEEAQKFAADIRPHITVTDNTGQIIK